MTVLDEILELQKQLFGINRLNLSSKTTVHKKPVNKFDLEVLASYFRIKINPKCHIHNTPRYIKVESESVDIIIKEREHE